MAEPALSAPTPSLVRFVAGWLWAFIFGAITAIIVARHMLSAQRQAPDSPPNVRHLTWMAIWATPVIITFIGANLPFAPFWLNALSGGSLICAAGVVLASVCVRYGMCFGRFRPWLATIMGLTSIGTGAFYSLVFALGQADNLRQGGLSISLMTPTASFGVGIFELLALSISSQSDTTLRQRVAAVGATAAVRSLVMLLCFEAAYRMS